MSSNRFNPFHYTYTSVTNCCNAMDSNPSSANSDQQREENCCTECQWLCWPLIFTFDVISCPIRCGHYCFTKGFKSSETQSSETQSSETQSSKTQFSDTEKSVYNTKTITIEPS